jgi:hypothetical protein
MGDYKDINFGGEILQLNRFDLKTLIYDCNKDYMNPRIAIIAKSGSGKSWVIREIMHYMRDIPCGVVIAPTDKMTGFYNDFLPPSFIHHEYKQDIIPRLLQRQKTILEKNKRRKKDGKKLIDPRVFLIMDDCMSTKHLWLKDPNVLAVFNEGRHYQITFILAMQYSLGIQPELRSNFDYIFLLGEDFVNNRKKLYEHYAGMFPTRLLFDQVFMQVTDDYGVMVINNRLRTSNIRKKVFWYKAKKRLNFNVGCKYYNTFHDLYFDANHDKRLPYIDFSNFGNKNKINVVVRKLED